MDAVLQLSRVLSEIITFTFFANFGAKHGLIKTQKSLRSLQSKLGAKLK